MPDPAVRITKDGEQRIGRASFGVNTRISIINREGFEQDRAFVPVKIEYIPEPVSGVWPEETMLRWLDGRRLGDAMDPE